MSHAIGALSSEIKQYTMHKPETRDAIASPNRTA